MGFDGTNFEKYMGLMGMYEMEVAVEIMEKKAEKHSTTIDKMSYHPNDFVQPQDADSLVGFTQLVANGWIVPDYPNSAFIPSKELIARLNERWGTNYSEPTTFLSRLRA